MKNKEKVIPAILALVTGVILVFSFTLNPSENPKADEYLNGKKNYDIVKKWELPEVLEEISGIAWIGDNRIACVQDEDGKIFVYNLKTSKLEDPTVSFGSSGDYEGITIKGEDAYVLRSDGTILEVKNFLGKAPQVKKYVTKINGLPGINIEGLGADLANNRLLLAVKERKNFSEHKEIYAFDLENMETGKDPLFMVDLSDPIFRKVPEKPEKKFAPGEIGVHPHSGEYYILDGTRPKLLITDTEGTLKELHMLDPKDFGNPEGLTFNQAGDLFISNEAEGAPANILQVSLNRKSK